ncbi:MAG: hypothetical protein QHJ73_13095, partial [Armatimonadota bacterium]|nr:hypothetical protein [Armatimonadota bacterium]
ARSKDGKWACRWRILPTHAVMELERAAHPYWFLYEGTPGGKYDEAALYMVDSAGKRHSGAQRWERRLPDPRWIYFGTAGVPRVLFLADLTHRAPGTVDSFWSMQGNMTVFGFGRTLATGDRWHHLTEVPARFALGLIEETDHAAVAREVNRVLADLVPRP